MIGAGLAKVVAAAGVGAGVAYLFDRDRGRARRARLRDQTLATLRRDVRALERQVNYDRGRLKGVVHRAAGRQHRPPADDHVLVDRVRSSVLGRMPEIAHHVTLDAAGGVVTIRGQLDERGDIDRFERAVRGVEGVENVVNLLHTAGEPAPNKADALRADG